MTFCNQCVNLDRKQVQYIGCFCSLAEQRDATPSLIRFQSAPRHRFPAPLVGRLIVAAALAGIKTAGSDTITYGATLTADDSFLIAYTDGTNSYIAVATAGAANLTTSEGVDSVATIVELTGVSSLATLDSTDYTTIT